MGYAPLGDKISDAYFLGILPRIRRVRDKEGSIDIILTLLGFYNGVSGFISEETRKQVDKKVEELLDKREIMGHYAIIEWFQEVIQPIMRDKKLTALMSKSAITEEGSMCART